MNRVRAASTDGEMPAGAIVAVAVALAAIVGLIAGAIWGLTGTRTTGSTQPPAPTPSQTLSATSSATPSPTSGTVGPTAPTGPSTAPTAPGSAPPAPATTTTSADGWRLGSWRITNTGGALGVSTTARNTQAGPRSADLVLFVYIDGQHIATTTARVTDVPGGGTVPVEFTGTDPWKPGQKVLLLQVV